MKNNVCQCPLDALIEEFNNIEDDSGVIMFGHEIVELI